MAFAIFIFKNTVINVEVCADVIDSKMIEGILQIKGQFFRKTAVSKNSLIFAATK